MAPTKTSGLRVHGLTITELLALSAQRYGTAVMAEETAEEKAAREKAEADAKAGKDDKGKGGKTDDGEPTEAELAALGDAGKRALERVKADRERLRAEAAAAAEKARKYDELEEANKTEQQKRDEAAAETAKRAEKAETDLAKLTAALDAGLPHTMAARLVGSTPAELKKDAEALKEQLGSTGGGRQRRITSDADKGGDGPTGGMSSLIRRAAGRQA